MAWLADHLKAMLTIVAALGLILGGARWVWGAEEVHKKARSSAEILESLTEIVENQQKQLERDEALKKQREKIRECLRMNQDEPERCVH